MPQLTGTWTPADGAALDVRVGLSKPDVLLLRSAARPVPQPKTVTALLDTGAEVSCIDPAAVKDLGLSWKGFTLANLPALGGLGAGAQYSAALSVRHPSGNKRDDFEIPELILTELSIGTLGNEMLIGRDILALCVLRFDGPALAFTLDY